MGILHSPPVFGTKKNTMMIFQEKLILLAAVLILGCSAEHEITGAMNKFDAWACGTKTTLSGNGISERNQEPVGEDKWGKPVFIRNPATPKAQWRMWASGGFTTLSAILCSCSGVFLIPLAFGVFVLVRQLLHACPRR